MEITQHATEQLMDQRRNQKTQNTLIQMKMQYIILQNEIYEMQQKQF